MKTWSFCILLKVSQQNPTNNSRKILSFIGAKNGFGFDSTDKHTQDRHMVLTLMKFRTSPWNVSLFRVPPNEIWEMANSGYWNRTLHKTRSEIKCFKSRNAIGRQKIKKRRNKKLEKRVCVQLRVELSKTSIPAIFSCFSLSSKSMYFAKKDMFLSTFQKRTKVPSRWQ